jgi:DNA (cytosine-5)-methyltransferase 1
MTAHTLRAATKPHAIAFNANDYRSGSYHQVAQADPITTSADRSRAAPIVAFSAKDHGADAGELAPTLRAGGHAKSHANAGVMPAVAIQGAGRTSQGSQGSGINNDISFTLNNVDVHGVAAGMQVRRLTPRECERLQGFPDDYTLIPHRGKSAADGPRYKVLGNSMAVPVMRWIGERIQAVEEVMR